MQHRATERQRNELNKAIKKALRVKDSKWNRGSKTAYMWGGKKKTAKAIAIVKHGYQVTNISLT